MGLLPPGGVHQADCLSWYIFHGCMGPSLLLVLTIYLLGLFRRGARRRSLLIGSTSLFPFSNCETSQMLSPYRLLFQQQATSDVGSTSYW